MILLKKVKQCRICGCLFICNNPKSIKCLLDPICMCNDCRSDKDYQECDITIIRSPIKKRNIDVKNII